MMTHGSRLVVGEAELRLRMFAGFESAGVTRAPMQEDAITEQPSGIAAQGVGAQDVAGQGVGAQGVAMQGIGAQGISPSSESAGAQQAGTIAVTPEQLAAFQQMQWMLAWQAMQAQGLPGQGMPPAQLGQSVPGQGAPETGATPTVPVSAVLSTEQGDFSPPPKGAPSGAILATEVSAQGKPSGGVPQPPPANTQPIPEPPRRHTRVTPRPAVEQASAPVAEPFPEDATLPPLPEATAGGDLTADTMWHRVREQQQDSDLRRITDAEPMDNLDAAPVPNATFAPRVTFYPPVQDEEPMPNAQPESQQDGFAADAEQALEAWPYATYPQSDVHFTDSGYTYPEYVEPGAADEPYEYADEDEAPRSLYVEPDEAEQAKRVLWDRYLKGGRRR